MNVRWTTEPPDSVSALLEFWLVIRTAVLDWAFAVAGIAASAASERRVAASLFIPPRTLGAGADSGPGVRRGEGQGRVGSCAPTVPRTAPDNVSRPFPAALTRPLTRTPRTHSTRRRSKRPRGPGCSRRAGRAARSGRAGTRAAASRSRRMPSSVACATVRAPRSVAGVYGLAARSGAARVARRRRAAGEEARGRRSRTVDCCRPASARRGAPRSASRAGARPRSGGRSRAA